MLDQLHVPLKAERGALIGWMERCEEDSVAHFHDDFYSRVYVANGEIQNTDVAKPPLLRRLSPEMGLAA
jgi:hypothetical protein